MHSSSIDNLPANGLPHQASPVARRRRSAKSQISATIDHLPADGLLRYASVEARRLSWVRSWIDAVFTVGKGTIVFAGTLALVTAVTALFSCLFMAGGDIAYLTNPADLFDFMFNVRVGMKVSILFVTLLLFFLAVNDGLLTRNWVFGRSAAHA